MLGDLTRASGILLANGPTPRSGGARSRRGGAGLASRSQRHRHCVGWAGRPGLGRGVRTRRGHPHPRLDRAATRSSPRPVCEPRTSTACGGARPDRRSPKVPAVAPGRLPAARAVGRRRGRAPARRTPGWRRCSRRPTRRARARSRRAIVVAPTRCCPGSGTRLRARCGAAAAAVLLGPDEDGAPALLGPAGQPRACRSSTATAATARHAPATSTTAASSARRSSCPLATEVGEHARGARRRAWSLPDPDGRLGAALAPQDRRRPGRSRPTCAGRRRHRRRRRPARRVPARSTRRRRSRSSAPAAAGPPASASTVDAPVPGRPRGRRRRSRRRASRVRTREVLRARGQLVPAGETSRWACRPRARCSCAAPTRCSGCSAAGASTAARSARRRRSTPPASRCGGAKLEPVPLARARRRPHLRGQPRRCRRRSSRRCRSRCVDLDDGARVMLQVDRRRRRPRDRRRGRARAAPLRARARRPRLRLQGRAPR